MVLPILSSPTKIRHLSYADHAKKAQNIKSPNSTQPHRVLVQSLPTTSGISASSDQSVSPSKSISSPSAVDVKSDSGVIPTRHTDSHFPSSSTTDTSNVMTINGGTRANSDLAEKALSVVAAHTSSQKSPVVNVWNVRKQQLAAARAALTTALAKEVPLEEQAISLSSESTSQTTLPSISAFKSFSAPAPNTSHGPSAMTNGVTSTSQKAEHDPFVVRMGVKTMKSLPPPVDDTDSWPEVGKSAAFTQTNANPAARVDDSATRNESEGDQVSTNISRKSEKTKWVPIPPKELQATADALTKPTKRQSRKGTQHASHSRPGARSSTHTADGSASGSAQSRSRGHSASLSASQSRVQSRSESSQSSPHFARERRLPADDVYGAPRQGALNHHKTASQSSRTSSPPPLVVHPHLQPPRSTIDLNLSSDNETRTVPCYGQAGVQTLDDSSSSQQQPASQTQQQYHYLSTAHVPIHPQQNGYASQSGTPPLPPVPYPDPRAPYPVYAPYAAYDPIPHYSYRNTNPSHPGSGTHSPAYPPPQAGLPYYLTHFALTNTHQQHPQHQLPQLLSSTGEVRPRLSAPEQFQTVAGYKDASVGKEYPVVFGSIGVPGASQSPSPAPLSSRKADQNDGAGARGEEEDEKAFTMFSIGVAPGDGLSRLRAKAVSKMQTRVATAPASESETKTEGNTHASAESKIIDLTVKWEFGTATSSLREDGSVPSPSVCSENLRADTEAKNLLQETSPPAMSSITAFGVHHGKSTSGSPPGEVQTDAPQAESISSSMEGALLYPDLRGVGSGDDFEVKDFGYGFGPVSGSGRAPVITREERDERERERRREKEKIEKERMGRESQDLVVSNGHDNEKEKEKEKIKDMDVPVRSGRGNHNGGAAYDRSEGSVRRGRGFGRGRRGGFQQNIAQQRHPFTVTPPQALFQPLKTTGETPNGYYPQPRAPYSPGYDPYLSPTAGPTTAHTPAPVPVPVTTISFPLDPTRWYLLGQLEYYLSPQNMAQDFFLRQQMDEKGWIPVSLIASFNRIRQLTMDVHLVWDVLSLSSVVQVKGDWVRMNDWEQFVLPNATVSEVEKPDYEPTERIAESPQEKGGDVGGGDLLAADAGRDGEHNEGLKEDGEEEADDDCEDEDEDEDEEDVVFVLNHDDDGQPWPPEQFTSSEGKSLMT